MEPNYEGLGVIDSYFRTDGTGRKLMHQKAGGSLKPASHSTVDAREHYAFMDGRGVFKSAVNNMADSVLKVMERNNLTKEDIAWVVPHQANMRIIEAVGEQIGISLDKMMINIQRYGNTIAGTLPICLWEWEPRLKKAITLCSLLLAAALPGAPVGLSGLMTAAISSTANIFKLDLLTPALSFYGITDAKPGSPFLFSWQQFSLLGS